jgi:hypothetical protein
MVDPKVTGVGMAGAAGVGVAMGDAVMADIDM